MRVVGAAAGRKTPAKKFVRHPLIERYIDKYMAMLELPEAARPKVAISKSLSTDYLARAMWFSSHPQEFFLEFVEHVTNGSPRALEAIVAHEMVHVANMHADMVSILNRVDPTTGRATDELRKKMLAGEGHGRDFLRLAAKINEVEGENFVTVTSDMVQAGQAGQTKPYYVLLGKIPDGPVVVAWTVRLPKNMRGVREKIDTGHAAFIRTTDPFFASFSSKISDDGRMSLTYSRVPQVAARLAEEYEKAREYNRTHPEELASLLAVAAVKPYYVLIWRGSADRFAYAWSDDNPHYSALAVGEIRKGAVVVQTTDPRWRADRRAKIGSEMYLRKVYPLTGDKPALVKLLAEAPEVPSPYTAGSSSGRTQTDPSVEARVQHALDRFDYEGFTTSHGSTYDVLDKSLVGVRVGAGTRRTKAPHKGHDPKDVGLKPASLVTLYVRPEDGRRLGHHQQIVGEKAVAIRDGYLLLVTWNEKQAGWGISDFDRQNPILFSHTPRVGMSPLELWKPVAVGGMFGYADWHPGTPIVNVRKRTP